MVHSSVPKAIEPPVHILLDSTRRLIIGHRGAAAHAPENTIPSFRLAERAGADAVELDVHLTADGVPVVVHDPTLERTTGRNFTVASQPFERLRDADAGARFTRDGGRTFPWRGRGIQVPSLEEVVTALPRMPLLIELKTREAADPVRRVLWRTSALNRALVVSFDDRAILGFRDGATVTGAGQREMMELFARSVLHLLPARVDYQAIFVPRRRWGLRVPPEPFTRAGRALSIAVHTWVENDPIVARHLWSIGIAGIVTDDPGALRVSRDSG
jgi:glycerophosphoryl diester phosphodiesterase